MKCIKPIQLGSNSVPCGKCNYCLQQRRTDWSFRIYQELKVAQSASFLTLTYDDAKLPQCNHDTGEITNLPTLSKRDVQLFTKRLRKEQTNYDDTPLRYYTVGEYGSVTHRPHYHSIMFNADPQVINKLPQIWNLGNVHVGSVTMASIHYTTKYVINRTEEKDKLDGRMPSFLLCPDGQVLGLTTSQLTTFGIVTG